jgi:hypothetical protein
LLQPFRTNLPRHQDWDWLLRCSKIPGVGIHMVEEALSVFDIGGSRPSISRGLSWEFSVAWAEEMRHYLSRRAYSHFLGIYCVCSAARCKAGVKAYIRLLGSIFSKGEITIGLILRFLFYAAIPDSFRTRLASVRERGLAILH